MADFARHHLFFFLFRCSRRQYVAGRILGCYLSGGLVLFLGILLAYGVSFLLFAPMEATKPDLVQGQGIPEVLQREDTFIVFQRKTGLDIDISEELDFLKSSIKRALDMGNEQLVSMRKKELAELLHSEEKAEQMISKWRNE